MFKKRHLQVRLVKDEKTTPTITPEMNYADKLVLTNAAAKNFLREGAKLVCGVIVLDTLRKVAIEYAKK